jgi:hypothetical protein
MLAGGAGAGHLIGGGLVLIFGSPAVLGAERLAWPRRRERWRTFSWARELADILVLVAGLSAGLLVYGAGHHLLGFVVVVAGLAGMLAIGRRSRTPWEDE